MGLITGLLTLPLAPVRGTMWLAEKIQEQAELEMNDESAVLEGLRGLQELRESGMHDEAEIEAAEEELIERLMTMRGYETEGIASGGLE
jgi:gas vesicle protein GvpG